MPKLQTPPEIELLHTLSNAVAVSGEEGAVRKIILEAIRPYADDVRVDALGNVLAVKKSKKRNAPRVLVDAHMDEVGFMVTGFDSDGGVKFEAVGNVDDRAWLGKPVLVGPNRVPGVMGAAPVHVLSADQRMSVVKARALRIDIGAESAEAAKRLVKAGERGTFATQLDVLGGVSLRGKALDDRLGCATLVELLKGGPYPCELHAAFTVQEEVGLRGAKVAAFAVNPAAAFALDCTPANDLPHSIDERENVTYNTRVGHGPAIYTVDAGTFHNEKLSQYLQNIAASRKIPYQLRQPGGGRTDASAIQLSRAGIPAVSVSVPGRYLHTAAAHALLEDWRNSVKLLSAALSEWDGKILKD